MDNGTVIKRAYVAPTLERRGQLSQITAMAKGSPGPQV